MACDPNTLLEQAKCYQCALTGDLFPAVEIVLLCAWRDGGTLSCDPQSLVAQASCIRSCIPLGMMPAVKTAILCDIASCVGPTAPSNVAAAAAGNLMLDVTWTDNSSDETGFDVRWRNLTTGGPFVNAPSEPADATTATVDASGGSSDGDSIEVQVRASGTDCASDWVSAPSVIITDIN
jgi:hypothetical protein